MLECAINWTPKGEVIWNKALQNGFQFIGHFVHEWALDSRNPMSAICVIFDLDGTLVDSETLCNQAFLDLLPQLTVTVDSLVQANKGKKLASILVSIERALGRALPSTFEEEYRTRVADLFARNLAVVPGVKEMLDAVDAEKCVASSGPPQKIRQALEVAGIAQHFVGKVFSSYEVGAWKPDPGLFLHAADAMGFAPNQCAVIEDSEVGVEAGILAGMRVFQYVAHGGAAPASGAAPFSRMSQLPRLLARFAAKVQPSLPPDDPAAASRRQGRG